MNTFRAIVQLTPAHQTRYRQDRLVVSVVSVWTESARPLDKYVERRSVSGGVGTAGATAGRTPTQNARARVSSRVWRAVWIGHNRNVLWCYRDNVFRRLWSPCCRRTHVVSTGWHTWRCDDNGCQATSRNPCLLHAHGTENTKQNLMTTSTEYSYLNFFSSQLLHAFMWLCKHVFTRKNCS